MCFFSFPQWQNLRHIIFTVFTIIICPSLYYRYISGPISMRSMNRCGPFQGCCLIWILRSHLTSSPNTVKEVDNKQELNQQSDDRTNGNKFINPCKVLEGIKGIKTI